MDEISLIKRGAVEIIEEEELREKLKEGRPLRVKAGFDPTAPDLHLGHVVLLQKLRHFQDLGHEVFFVIGDFTATIGDPTGRDKTRPPLSKEEVLENAKTYERQIFKVLLEERTKVVFNSRWIEPLGTRGIINLCAKYTVARMLEREDFNKRFKEGIPLYIHEFLYPLLQGYDSVYLRADVELGGTDQKFNLLVGRDLQREFNLEPQVCITMPLLVGIDGKRKMSKSFKNYIGIEEEPKVMFSKVMAIPDEVMWDYFELLTDYTQGEIERLKSIHPMDAKKELAFYLVKRFHSLKEAKEAKEWWERTFSKGEFPEDAPTFYLKEDRITALELLLKVKACSSKNEARRIIKGGGLRINGERVLEPTKELELKGELRVKVGKKRFFKVVKA